MRADRNPSCIGVLTRVPGAQEDLCAINISSAGQNELWAEEP